MSHFSITTNSAPKAIGAYSQAVKADHFLFVSGQLPIDPATGKIETEVTEKQAIQVLNNIKAILQAANATFSQVVSVDIFLQDMKDFAAVNTLYSETFKDCPVKPARKTIQVAALPMNAKIEIACIAFI